MIRRLLAMTSLRFLSSSLMTAAGLVGLGGGAVTDLAGFAAASATSMRSSRAAKGTSAPATANATVAFKSYDASGVVCAEITLPDGGARRAA